MTFKYKDKEYEINILKKDNKNTYVRVRDDIIYVTTNYFTKDKEIDELLEENRDAIEKMIDRANVRKTKKELFLVFGKFYDVIYGDFEKQIIIEENTIKVKNEKVLFQWIDALVNSTFYNRLMHWFDEFEEDIPIPTLKIKKMKTRWGVCNTRTKCVTLNLDLFRYERECLDYVIIHELTHFLVPNHSKKFWNIVEKYCPNYKELRKKLRS